jgi:hypothetical protein
MDEMGAARSSALVRKGSLKQEKKQLEKHPLLGKTFDCNLGHWRIALGAQKVSAGDSNVSSGSAEEI